MASAAASAEKAAVAIRDKAAADKAAVAGANDLLQRMTLSTSAVEEDQRAAVANATANRQLANAAAGTAREEEHLSNVIRAGVGEMIVEARSTTTLAQAKDRLAASSGKAASKVAGVGQAAARVRPHRPGLRPGRHRRDHQQHRRARDGDGRRGRVSRGPSPSSGSRALFATPHVKEFYAGLTGSTNELPKNADAIKRIDEELGRVNSKLGEYKDKQSLTNAELRDYNKLSAEQVELEKQKNEEAERRNALAGITGIASRENTERASGFREAVAEAGGGERAAAQLRQALENQGMGVAEAAKKADDLLIEAGKGIKSSIEEIRDVIRQNMADTGGGQKLADAIQGSTPEAKAAAKAGAERDKARADGEEKARKANDDLVDRLNRQGQDNQNKTFEDKAKEDAQDEKDGLKGLTRAQREQRAADARRKAGDQAERKQGEGLAKQYSRPPTWTSRPPTFATQLQAARRPGERGDGRHRIDAGPAAAVRPGRRLPVPEGERRRRQNAALRGARDRQPGDAGRGRQHEPAHRPRRPAQRPDRRDLLPDEDPETGDRPPPA